MRDLTVRQESILQFILESIETSGRFPSYREIGLEFELNSVATVAQHLDALVKKGYLLHQGRKLMPAPGIRRENGIPVLGEVAAGQPIDAIESHSEHLRWDDFGRDSTFAVRVVGDSMMEEGILEDDYVIVQPSETARSGDLVVAYLGEETQATVKRFYRMRDRIELRPANRRYLPIRVSLREPTFRIAGRVVGVVRKL